MKFHLVLSLALVIFASRFAHAQAPAAATLPDNLKAAAALLTNTFPKVEAKKAPKAPADSVWLFRANTAAAGTVEVGFQGAEVVYMIFRRGTGGTGWKLPEIIALHDHYHRDLLKEQYAPVLPYFSKYNHSIIPAITAGVITRKDFDPKKLTSAF